MDTFIFYKADDGTVMQVTEFKPADRDNIVKKLKDAERVVLRLQNALKELDGLIDAPVQPDTEAQPKLIGEDDGDGHVNFKAVQI